MIFRSLTRSGRKVRVSPTAFAALCRHITLTRLGEIEKQFISLRIKNLRADRYLDDSVFAVLAITVRTFAVTAAFGFVLRVVAKVQQSI